MEFQPIFKANAKPNWGNVSAMSFFRAQFDIETIMIVGALAQIVLSAVLPLRYALIPAAFLGFVKVANVYAIKTGLKKNPYMEDAIMAKISAQFPDKAGKFGNQPARESVCVFMIGARNNSPLGIMDSRFAKIGEAFDGMIRELKEKPEETGFLGSSAWTGHERSSGSTTMTIMYFKSAAHVHEYAHGPKHREIWTWWYNNIKDLKEIGIFHELYEVPSGNYECIYDHYQPVLAGATQHKVIEKTEQGEQEVWMSPLVDARKGQLKSSRGRMARSNGAENNKYGHDDEAAYGDVKV